MAVEWTCSLYWNCTSKVVGETEEEVVKGAVTHAAEHHDMDELDDAVVEQIRGEIVAAPPQRSSGPARSTGTAPPRSKARAKKRCSRV